MGTVAVASGSLLNSQSSHLNAPNNAASALMNLQQAHNTHNQSSHHSLLQSNAASNFHLNPNATRQGAGGHHHNQYGSYQSGRGHQDSSVGRGGTSLLTVNTAGVMRTINVSGSGETQTILINDGEFNGGSAGGSAPTSGDGRGVSSSKCN